ncbi:MAG: response regulator transcription factor [Anaerolineales bacterium]|nr:response regulator transcription factor [Anaerolineales bacterium]
MAERPLSGQRILIVEDESALLVFYRQVLDEAGYRTRAARSGPEALAAFTEFAPELVILDLLLMGDMDGFEVLAALRARSPVRIVILTGQTGDARVVRGLNLGADNYLAKPISREQLIARVRAHLRRTVAGNLAPERMRKLFYYGDLVIDLARAQALQRGRRYTFGDVERRILERLLRTPGQLVTYVELMEVGWGMVQPTIVGEDTRGLLNVAYRLRRKLRQTEGQDVIETVANSGLIIRPPDRDAK